MSGQGWIGVDLDGTLAQGHNISIGPPVEKMVARVKKWLDEGKEVRIVTARADDGEPMRRAIAAWCIYHIGKELPITNKKDYSMVELWDDRAVQVVPNTGERADGKA